MQCTLVIFHFNWKLKVWSIKKKSICTCSKMEVRDQIIEKESFQSFVSQKFAEVSKIKAANVSCLLTS